MAASGLFSSCASDAAGDEPDSHTAELQFTIAETSRAAATSTLYYPGAEFAVYGDMLPDGTASSANSIVIFNGVGVKYDGSNWVYDDTQYWFPKHEHSFVAIHPAAPAGATNTGYAGNCLTVDYALPESYADAPDLLFATHRRKYEAGATLPVALSFSHAMSRVNFMVRCDGAAEKIIVKEVKLKGLGKSGTLTITPAPLASGQQTDDYNMAWTGTRKDETLTAGIEVEIADGSRLPLFPDDNALFVIPQPDNKNIAVEISYTMYFTNGNTEDCSATAQTPIGGWQPGMVYNYSLAFTSEDEPIKINVTVNEWKVGATDDVTVPRK